MIIKRTSPLKLFRLTKNNFKTPLVFFILLGILILSIILQYVFFPPDNLFADEGTDFVESFNKDLSLPEISAESAILIDYETGEVLGSKNPSERLYPASTTKMLAAILTIEKIDDLNEIIKISNNAAGRNNSFFTFNRGDEISLLDLLKSALICSHNNATIALAEYIAGTESNFVDMMNQKAISIGAYNTSFQNTNGLDSNYPEHKSTAEDLAIIAKYCMENDLFREIVSKKEDYIKINGERQIIYNTNILLFFDYIKGIKTGFTDNAGYCQVLYSEREGLSLITVILKSQNNKREEDLLRLIDWANDTYKNTIIIDPEKMYKKLTVDHTKDSDAFKYTGRLFLNSYPAERFEALLSISDDVKINDSFLLMEDGNYIADLPVEFPLISNKKLGFLSININGRDEGEIDILSGDSVSGPYIQQNLDLTKNNNFRNLLIFLISFYFLVFIFIIIKNLLLRRNRE